MYECNLQTLEDNIVGMTSRDTLFFDVFLSFSLELLEKARLFQVGFLTGNSNRYKKGG